MVWARAEPEAETSEPHSALITFAPTVKTEPPDSSSCAASDCQQEAVPEIAKRPKVGRTARWRERPPSAPQGNASGNAAEQGNAAGQHSVTRRKRRYRPRLRKWQYLSEKEEAILSKFVRQKMTVTIGCTRQELLDMAVQLAQQRGTPFPGGQPTMYWLHSFRKKNPGLVLRRSKEAKWYTDRGAKSTEPFLTRLAKLLAATGLGSQPARVWTMDDRGLQLSVGTQKITTIVCGNASGAILPPFIIFQGMNTSALNGYDTERAPDGTQISMADYTWTENDILRAWFETSFLPKIGPERPQILIYGGYEEGSHVAIQRLAGEHGVHGVALPGQTSNWTQPLVRSVFRTFTSALFAECDRLTATRGQELTSGEFFRVFSAAWSQVTPADLRNGFTNCGIEL